MFNKTKDRCSSITNNTQKNKIKTIPNVLRQRFEQCTNQGFHFHCKYFRFLSLSVFRIAVRWEHFHSISATAIGTIKVLRKKITKERKRERKKITTGFLHASLDCSRVFFSHHSHGQNTSEYI